MEKRERGGSEWGGAQAVEIELPFELTRDRDARIDDDISRLKPAHLAEELDLLYGVVEEAKAQDSIIGARFARREEVEEVPLIPFHPIRDALRLEYLFPVVDKLLTPFHANNFLCAQLDARERHATRIAGQIEHGLSFDGMPVVFE